MLESHYFSRSIERECLMVFNPALDPREPVECVDVMLKPFDDAQDKLREASQIFRLQPIRDSSP
jgi:hypothetical protein